MATSELIQKLLKAMDKSGYQVDSSEIVDVIEFDDRFAMLCTDENTGDDAHSVTYWFKPTNDNKLGDFAAAPLFEGSLEECEDFFDKLQTDEEIKVVTLNEQQSNALAAVNAKVDELQAAIHELNQVYDFNTVGLQEWIEDLDDVMGDIEAELVSTKPPTKRK
jgi:hypothetical protein